MVVLVGGFLVVIKPCYNASGTVPGRSSILTLFMLDWSAEVVAIFRNCSVMVTDTRQWLLAACT